MLCLPQYRNASLQLNCSLPCKAHGAQGRLKESQQPCSQQLRKGRWCVRQRQWHRPRFIFCPHQNTSQYNSKGKHRGLALNSDGKGHGYHTHPRGQTAAVYQENRYWQSAVSWLNSGIPSFTRGSQWKKMVEETDLVLSFPHLEDEANTTSRSPSVTQERRP